MAFIDEYYDQSGEAKWYVAHTYSGYENKVKTNLEKIVENRGIGDKIVDVRVPVEVVTEIDGGKEKQVENKIFPSYVLIKMIMSDETWHVVRNISGVTGFVGPGSKPIPLTDAEVEALGVEENTPKVSVSFKVGDAVVIIDGPLEGSRGTVQEISPDLEKVTVLANMFGRETPFELETKSIKLAD
ncbi:MAG: transcription termination/antitermination factor NusG [Ruminococcaceae bacterium]|nr:transcription termination/antitermination factor NusG [Oscillospiraceae bacterium]